MAKRNSSLTTVHLLNVGGAAISLLGVFLVVQSSFTSKPDTPLCETRYTNGSLFSYTRQGAGPLSVEDLQSRLGGTDRGLLKNSKIVPDDKVPFGHALEIQLKRSAQEEDEQTRSGIGFTWAPRQLVSATAACLSYSVWTPPDFKMGDGGVLPGFVSDMTNADEALRPQPVAATPAAGDAGGQVKLPLFSTRPQWRSDGTLMLWQIVNIGGSTGVALEPTKAALKPGQWMRIEEEAILNTPGRADGVLRAWVNGKLVLERFDIGFRKDEVQSFQAVVGDVHHLRHGQWAPAPADAKIRLSPLELRIR